jgi:hypothetical protein
MKGSIMTNVGALRAVLAVQWQRARVLVILLSLAVFILPVFIVGQRYIEGPDFLRIKALVDAAQSAGKLFPVLALGLGLALGVMAWADDQRAGHVYALTLPQSRERYVLMRYAAAGVLLLIPIASLLGGAIIASNAVDLPEGVRAYPLQLTARFSLAAFTCYSVFFALSIATRRAARIIAFALVLVIVGELVTTMFIENFSLVNTILHGATLWPSPFALLTGRWALFDA